jgi:hypothetical protein
VKCIVYIYSFTEPSLSAENHRIVYAIRNHGASAFIFQIVFGSALLESCIKEEDLEATFKEFNNLTMRETRDDIPIFRHAVQQPSDPPGSKCHPRSKLLRKNYFSFLRDLSSCPWNFWYSSDDSRYPRFILNATLKHCGQKRTGKNSQPFCLSLRKKKGTKRMSRKKTATKIRLNRAGECRSLTFNYTAFYRENTTGCFYPKQEATIMGFTCILRQI